MFRQTYYSTLFSMSQKLAIIILGNMCEINTIILKQMC